jgi:hypothetical protein
MSLFGKTAFSGIPFMFWSLAPILFGCALMSGWFTFTVAMAGKFLPAAFGATGTVALLCGVLVLFNPRRFSWAGRVVTGTIFVGYLGYAIHEWFFTDHPFRWLQRTSAASPRNALLGLIVIGGPCLWFTIMGRWTRGSELVDVPRSQPPGRPPVEVLGIAPRVERPMLAEEIARLKEAAVFRGPTAGRMLFWGTLWSGVTVGGVWSFLVLLADADHGQPSWLSNLIPICFLGSILTFYIAYSSFRAVREVRAARRHFVQQIAPRLQAALADGRASVVSVEAASVIEIEVEEADGSAWLFALADGTTLYLRGDDYFPAEQGMPWPTKRFEVVRAALNDQWIGLYSKGPELELDFNVLAEEMPDDVTWAEEPASESILAGPPRENLRRLGHRPAEPADD